MAVANLKVPVEIVLLSEIEVDPKYNARSDVHTTTGGPDNEKGGFEGLCNSIALNGQDTPVILRKTPKGKKPYFLVAGFRRVEAIRKNAEEKGNKAPTVKAEIKELTDKEAREINMRENTARDDLAGPDLCYGIGQILDADGKNPDGTYKLSSVQVANMLGMNQSYVAKMIRIWKGAHPKVIGKWRTSLVKLTVDQLDGIAKLEAGKQDAAYEEMVKGKSDDKTKDKKNAWLDAAIRKGKEMGTMFGKLFRDGHLEILGDDFFGENVRTLVNFKTSATEVQVSKVAHALEKGFEEGQEEEETEEEKANAEANGAPKGAKKAAAKAKGKGGKAGATAN